jgi:hypothetical protein
MSKADARKDVTVEEYLASIGDELAMKSERQCS